MSDPEGRYPCVFFLLSQDLLILTKGIGDSNKIMHLVYNKKKLNDLLKNEYRMILKLN